MKAALSPSTLERPRSRRPLQELTPPQPIAPSPSSPPPSQAPPPSLFSVRVLLLENADDRVLWYNVRIVCQLRPELSWRVARRYRDFDALLQALRHETLSVPPPPLPPKVLPLMLNSFLQQQRVIGLQRWCQDVLACPSLCGHAAVSEFFDLDFGLWHQRAAAPQPPVLDAACSWAAVTVQSSWRAHRVQQSLRHALAAATHGAVHRPRADVAVLVGEAGQAAGSALHQLVLMADSSSNDLASLVRRLS